MPPHFLRQDKGLLIVPNNKPKKNVSWTLDNVLCGFRYFYEQHGRWPVHVDLKNCQYLPNVKTLERKFKGITNIRSLLGILNNNFSSGENRSKISKETGVRGFQLEEIVYSKLIEIFYEPYVHYQSRVKVSSESSLRVDFLVYHKNGKFAIDVFFPDSDITRFSANIRIKAKIYQSFSFTLFLCKCIGNPTITPNDILSQWINSGRC